MNLPTLRNDLAKVYERKAPAPSQRLIALRAAKEAGLHVCVALAPTYPECDEAGLRATLQAVAELEPVTIFHEPINIRAENVARIEAHAESLGIRLQGKLPRWVPGRTPGDNWLWSGKSVEPAPPDLNEER